jgi:hypothetical protein
MAHRPTPVKSLEENIWTGRLASSLQRSKTLENQFQLRPIPGPYGEYFKQLILQILARLQTSEHVKELLSDPRPLDETWIVEITSASAKIEAFLNHAGAMIVQASQIPRDLIRFVDDINRRFSDHPTPYLLAIPFVGGTPFTQDYMDLTIKPNIELFPEPRNYARHKEIFVINLSSEIVDVPANWPLLIHETAHIIESQEFKIRDRYYPEESTEDYNEREANWALEITCDAIATYCCGPIFGNRLLSKYARIETRQSETHPPLRMRLEIIAELLTDMNWTKEADDIRAQLRKIPGDMKLVKLSRPKFTQNILKELRKAISAKGLLYELRGDKRATINQIAKRLEEFKPCVVVGRKTVETLDLLNASHYADLKMTAKPSYAAFQNFLGDMIRLANINQEMHIGKLSQ